MPPWHANPEVRPFLQRQPAARRRARKLIFDWIDNGAPRAIPADLPRAARITSKAGEFPSPTCVSGDAGAVHRARPTGTVEYQDFERRPHVRRRHLDSGRRGAAGQSRRWSITWCCSICRRAARHAARGGRSFNSLAASRPDMPPSTFRRRGRPSAIAGRLEACVPGALHAQRHASKPTGARSG